MADARTDAERWRELLSLWEGLAACWDGSPRGARLRAAVLAPLQSAAPSLAGVWLNQARAVAAWHDLAAAKDEAAAAPPYCEWDALRDQAEQLRRRVQDEQRAAKSRLTNLLSPAKEQQTLLADLAAFLQQGSDAFAKLAAAAPAAPLTPAETIQKQIDQMLAALPQSWPPGRLATFFAKHADGGAAGRLDDLIESAAPDWRAALGESIPDLSDDVRETLILLRGLVECFSESDAAAAVWPGVAKLARDLLPASQLQAELVRDPKQPAAWFEPPVEGAIRVPRVARVGLALRLAGRDWFCFPPGRLLVPKPVPRTAAHDAGDALVAQVAANPWLARLGGRTDALRDAAQPAATPCDPNFWLEVLDDLAADAAEAAPSLRELPSDKSETLDRLLELLRRLLAADGLEILPREWCFAAPPSLADLHDAEVIPVAVFRPDDPRGAIYRVRTFGLKVGDRTIRYCHVAVSAGPLPFGFRELENLVKDDPHEAALRDRLKAWRDAGLAGTLELTAVQFYVDFWGALGDGLRRRDPDRARDFGQKLTELLQHDFRLFPFHPAAFQDFPDGWVQRTPGRQMTTGLVRRVLRPGLQDDHNHLRVPALVEVE